MLLYKIVLGLFLIGHDAPEHAIASIETMSLEQCQERAPKEALDLYEKLIEQQPLLTGSVEVKWLCRVSEDRGT